MTLTRLKTSTAVAYGAPAFMLAAFGITFYVYLPKFYADEIGINLTTLGIIVIAARLWDAVTDPAIGALSDRTRSRLGRRRPWMIAAAIPLAVSFYLLLTPPMAEGTVATARFAALSFVFFLFWTLVAVPYESLGAEISFDYDERNRLFGVRETVFLLGTMTGTALPAAIGHGTAPSAGGWELVGLTYGALLLVLIAWCAGWVRERRWTERQRPAGSLLSGIRPVLANRPFVILLTGYTLFSLGAAMGATLILFYVEDVLGSTRGPAFLVLYLALGAVFLPIWVVLAKRMEKRKAWLLALTVNTGGFAGVLFLGMGDALLFGVFLGLAAVGVGGTIAIPPSMQADVIDYDQWQSGTRREGQYVGIWALAKKLAMALGAGIAFPILDWAGYAVGTEVQSPNSLRALRLLYVGTPLLCNVAAIAIAWRYPIGRAMHERIRGEIDVRPHAIGTQL